MGMINNIGSWMLNRIVGESTADDDDNPENAGTSSRPLSYGAAGRGRRL
jgi:hypothetical protein